MDKTGIMQLKEGEILFKQGEESRVLYKLLAGEIALYLNYGTEDQKELARIEKDNCFGEMGVLEHKPRTATAIAMNDCVLMAFSEEQMELFISQNTKFALKIMKDLSAKLRNANKELEEM